MKRFTFYLAFALLSGCTVPGSYMGSLDEYKTVRIDGKSYTPQVTKITPKVEINQSKKDIEKPLGQLDPLQTTVTPLKINAALQHDFKPKPYRYAVGPYDVLNVIVWDHPELSMPTAGAGSAGMAGGGIGSALTMASSNFSGVNTSGQQSGTGISIGSNGDIFFPYAGKLQVAGLTVEQIAAKLENQLTKYINHPQVTVSVMAYRSQEVSVMGEVAGPRIVSITDKPLSILDAINMAGGLNPTSADPRHIFVVRGSITQPKVFWLDATEPEGLLLSSHFYLASNDIVYVSALGVSNFNKVMSNVLLATQAKTAVSAMAVY